jgi:1-acyl-sn-glycerol-3-phosphate acyltransferase
MPEKMVRAAKGFLMGSLFGVFLFGILFELLLVLPLIWVMNRVFGFKPRRAQPTIRLLIGLWLVLMKAFRLLKSTCRRGKIHERPAVIVSNHPGLFDVLFLIRDVEDMCVMVKRMLAKRLPLGPVFRAAGYVLSPDFEERGPLECLDEALEKIHMGYRFMIFPEATRSPKEGLGRFGPGAFMLARLAGVPVQPVLIRNVPPFLGKGEKWYFPPSRVSTVEIEFWDPMVPPRAGEDREFARNLEARYRKALGLAPAVLVPDVQVRNQCPAPGRTRVSNPTGTRG